MVSICELRSFVENRAALSDGDLNFDQFFSQIASHPGQGEVLQQLHQIGELDIFLKHPAFSFRGLLHIIEELVPSVAFYKEMGGLAGYKEKLLSLIANKPEDPMDRLYHAPVFTDISSLNAKTKRAISWGISAIPEMAEIFPLGGAADRLHLVDEATGSDLPAAKLVFTSKTLLERLVLDVQARERLYFLVHGKQVTTPIAIMTSKDKNNHVYVEQMLEENHWFGRPKEYFRLFTQPLVPVVDEKGNWLISDDFKLVLKPGGHGAIWKLALDFHIFSWFRSLGRKKALVRQINNPIAGLDYGLLAFTGIGWKKNCKFGFASCPRLLRAAEGVNVVIEKNKKTVVLTNIEYCDFAKFGIEDLPLKEGEPYSRFSSNTNILFVDLLAVEKAVEKCPYPGLLLNMKKWACPGKDPVLSGRLESTMQNLADVFVEKKKKSAATRETFITYNQRHKTISTTKRAYVNGGNLLETPESCLHDLLYAARELLENYCHFQLPSQRTLFELLEKGPEFFFLYAPALGPLYSMIQKKLQSGSFALGSELRLEISDLQIRHLSLEGSLRISSERIMGVLDEKNLLHYSQNVGRCRLKNVSVKNKGVDWAKSSPYWKGDFVRFEGVEILLKGDSEFIAHDVTFEGNQRFVVEDGFSMRVGPRGKRLLPLTRSIH